MVAHNLTKKHPLIVWKVVTKSNVYNNFIRHVIIVREAVQSLAMSALFNQDQTKVKEREKMELSAPVSQSVVKSIAIV